MAMFKKEQGSEIEIISDKEGNRIYPVE